MPNNSEIIIYQTPDGQTKIDVHMEEETGYGDYTAERKELLKDVMLDEVERELKAMQ